jgi:PiT family inorganic phosphate transporter
MSGGSAAFGMVVFLIVLALAFDFMNGFHDAANSIATVVSTRVLRPHFAVAWAAFFNFIAFLFFGLSVANAIGKGATRKVSAVRWGVAERIVWAWVLTIPCAAFISALAWWIAHSLG